MNILSLWSDTPRFLRGWFLGNFLYLLILLVTSNSTWGPAIIQAPFFIFYILSSSRLAGVVTAHLVWGGLGALFVGLTGEKVGPGILIILMVVFGCVCLMLWVSALAWQ
jgi:hypothetical protein